MKEKTNNQTCVFTVIYPGFEKFWSDFVNSIENQDSAAFDLFILNDGVTDFYKQLSNCSKKIIQVSATGVISEIREQGIKWLTESHYDHIVFADVDDYLSPNRVSKSVEMLQEADIYVNDISTASKEGIIIEEYYFSNRLKNGRQLDFRFLLNKNIMGLGNTAIRRKALQNIKIPRDIISVDWFLFTNLLLNGKKAVFSNEAITYYRQHDANSIGFKKADKKRIMKAVEAHYRHASYFSSVSELHKEYFRHIKQLKKYLSLNKRNVDLYVEGVQKSIGPFPFWWEEVKTLDELEYENCIDTNQNGI